MNLLRGDVRKLQRPAIAIAALFFAAFLVRFTISLANDASSSARVLPGGVTMPTDGSEPARIDQATLDRLKIAVRESHDLLSPFGSLSLLFGLAASGPGLAAIIILGSLHIGGEWDQRTAGRLFIAEPRTERICIVKTVSSVAAVVPCLLAGALTAIAVGIAKPINGVRGAGLLDLSLDTLERVGRATPVLLLFAASVLLTSVLLRKVVGSIVAAASFWIINAAVLSAITPRASLTYWVASWMNFRPAPSIAQDHLWQDTFGSSPASGHGLVSLTIILAVAAIMIALSWWRLSTADELA